MGVLDELQAQQDDYRDQMGQVNDYLNSAPQGWGGFFSMDNLHHLAQAPQMYQHWRQALNDIPGNNEDARGWQTLMGTEGAPSPAEAVGGAVRQDLSSAGASPAWASRLGTGAQYATEWTPIVGQGNAVGTGINEVGEGGWKGIGGGLYDIGMGAYGPDFLSLKELLTKGGGAALRNVRNLPSAVSGLRDYYSMGRETGGGLLEFLRDEGHDVLAHGAKALTNTPLGKEAVMHGLGYKDEIMRQYHNLFGDSGDYSSSAEEQGQGGMPPPTAPYYPTSSSGRGY